MNRSPTCRLVTQVLLILMNILFGIIIDTFGDLRQEKQGTSSPFGFRRSGTTLVYTRSLCCWIVLVSECRVLLWDCLSNLTNTLRALTALQRKTTACGTRASSAGWSVSSSTVKATVWSGAHLYGRKHASSISLLILCTDWSALCMLTDHSLLLGSSRRLRPAHQPLPRRPQHVELRLLHHPHPGVCL